MDNLYLTLSNNQAWLTKSEFQKIMNEMNEKYKELKFNMRDFENSYGQGHEYVLVCVKNNDTSKQWLLRIFRELKHINVCSEIKNNDDLTTYSSSQYIHFSDLVLKTFNEANIFPIPNNKEIENKSLFKYSIVLNNNQFWLKRDEFNKIVRDELKCVDELPLYKKGDFEYSNIVLNKPYVLISSDNEEYIKYLATNLLNKKVILKLYDGYQDKYYEQPFNKRVRYGDAVIRNAQSIFNLNNKNEVNAIKSEDKILTFEKLTNIDNYFNNKIIGQENAISEIKTQLISLFYEQNKNKIRNNPLGVFLFVGPTGVGKTKLCKLLSEFLYDNKNINRFDMSEYQDESAVFKLIGAPNGYKNSESGGALTNTLDKNPNAIILFDEIEKAHHSVFKLFLTMFDEGYFTSGTNKKYNIKNNFIILTSNLGASSINLQDDYEIISKKLNKEVKDFFTYKLGCPEVLGRISNENIIAFNSISSFNDQAKILNIHFDKFINEYKEEGVNLRFDKLEVYNEILSHVDPSLGARNIINEFKQFEKKFKASLFLNGVRPEDMNNINIEFTYKNKEVLLQIIK